MPQEKKRTRDQGKCRRCGSRVALISKYGLGFCRRCFKEKARELGFEKY